MLRYVGREHVDELVLGAVRVLVLVDQDVPEPLLVVLEDLRVSPEQTDRLADQVVEIESAGVALPPLVLGVDPRDRLLVEVRGHLGELLRAEHAVLCLADRRGHGLRRVALGVDVHVARDAGDQSFGITVVVDREVRGDAQMGVLPSAGSARRPSGTSGPTSLARSGHPGALPTRSAISREALFVKVIARI